MRSANHIPVVILLAVAVLSPRPIYGQARGGAAAVGGRGAVGQGQAGAGAAAGRGAASIRWEPWSAMRSAAQAVLGWKVGITAGSFPQLTFSDAVAKADDLGLGHIEGSSTQKLNAEIPKPVGYNLAPGEINAIKDRLNAMNVRMTAYRVPAIGPDEDSSRKLFDFAKNVGVETIVSERMPEALPMIDKLAGEYGVNVAVCGSPASVRAAVEGRSKRIGACGDTAAWMQEGIKPLEALAQLKDRLLVVNLRDRAGIAEFLREMYRLELQPSLITVGASGAGDAMAGLKQSFEAFEKALQPVMADRVDQMSRTAAIRGPDRLSAEEKHQIDTALPQQAPAKPKKARKLLVLDLNIAYPGHRSIPAENYALEQMGKTTGAYEAVFSNDLDNLKYEKIRQFDAVYLNNTVGMIFVDPEVREGLTRFVREGGGLAGNHGTSHASMDWPEFSEMIGVRRGVHRENTEQAWIRVDDPASPLTSVFDGREFLYQDEFFRFPNPPYSREKLHVLLNIDVEKTDMNQGRPCASPCVRPDYDYAVSWIRSYGKGRVFFSILGHNPTLFTTPPLARYFLAGIQFILGDLEADTTPSAKLPVKKQARAAGRE